MSQAQNRTTVQVLFGETKECQVEPVKVTFWGSGVGVLNTLDFYRLPHVGSVSIVVSHHNKLQLTIHVLPGFDGRIFGSETLKHLNRLFGEGFIFVLH
jgi:hypothetical protein